MKQSLAIITIILCGLRLAYGQGHGTPEQAMEVTASVCGPVYADGQPDEGLALKDEAGTYFEKPHSVAWFTFVATQDTLLTFDLVPSTPGEDIDFLLFKDESGNFSSDLKSRRVKPLRSNTAKCDKRLECKTGLSYLGLHYKERPGKHPAYSKPLKVKKGERFYLAVDNYTHEKNPFTLFMHLRFNKNTVLRSTGNDTIYGAYKRNTLAKITIKVIDSITGSPVSAKIAIDELTNNIIHVSASSYTVGVHKGQKINIVCNAPGYLLSRTAFVTPLKGNSSDLIIPLCKIKPHQNMVFRGIQFESDSPIFLPTSDESLNNLLDFMKNNPAVNILIKGYVNDPNSEYGAKHDQDLSEERAQAVLDFLAKNGIDKDRLSWKGYSNNSMIYPHPETEEEMEANRRVEIEVK